MHIEIFWQINILWSLNYDSAIKNNVTESLNI